MTIQSFRPRQDVNFMYVTFLKTCTVPFAAQFIKVGYVVQKINDYDIEVRT